MKKILTIVFLTIPFFLHSQNNWRATHEGNAFDGFTRMALNLDSTEEVALAVLNKNDQKLIDNNNLPDFYQGSLALVPNTEKYPQKKFPSIDKVLLSFDRNPEVFYVDFEAGDQYVSIKNAVRKDFNQFLTRYNIIDFLKTKNDVHFRLIFGDSTFRDYTISLRNSSSAINTTIQYPSDGSSTSDLFIMVKSWTDVWENLYHWKIVENVESELEKEFGPFAFRFVDFIDLSEDKLNLYVYLKYDVGEITIPREVFIKGAFDEKGNLIPDPDSIN